MQMATQIGGAKVGALEGQAQQERQTLMAERQELADMLKSFGEEVKQLRSDLAASERSRAQLEQSV